MAKTSALTALTAANAPDSDLIYIVDVSAQAGKKMTVGEAKKTFGSAGIQKQTLTSGSSIQADGANYDTFVIALSGNGTLVINSPVTDKFYLVRLTHTTAGSTLTLPGFIEKNPDGTPIGQSTGAGDYDEFAGTYNGSTFLWTYSKFGTGVGGGGTGGGGGSTGGSQTTQYLVFSTSNGLSNTGTSWAGTLTNNLYANYGKETTKKLAANTDGYIQFLWPGAAGSQCILAFRTDNVNGSYTDSPYYQAGAFINDNSGIYYIDNNVINSVTTPIADGTWIRIERTGSTFYIKTSVDKTTWTVRYTYTFASSAIVYPVLNINQTKSLPYVEGYNLS